MKRFMPFFRGFVSLLLCFGFLGSVGCRNKGSEADPVQSETEASGEIVIENDGLYTIVYHKDDVSGWRSAQKLALDLNRVCGIQLQVADDSSPMEPFEILIGKTSRSESAVAEKQMGNGDLAIVAVDQKPTLCASTEQYYQKGIDYLLETFFADAQLRIPKDLSYVQKYDDIQIFATDSRVGAEKTSVEITLRLQASNARAGIYVGNPQNGLGAIGSAGYCLAVSADCLTLYETFSDELKVLATKPIVRVKRDQEIKLLLVLEGRVLRGYFLDDATGVEPWPEFEMAVRSCVNYEIGYVELSEEACIYRDLKVSYGEKNVTPEKTYTNSVYANYADPEVIYHNGVFYLYGTGGAGGYRVHSSTDLINWKDEGIAAAYGLWGTTKNYWAPDLEYINGKFYMVATCEEKIGIAVSESPLGPFEAIGDQMLYERAIDGHLFVDDDGRIYLYFVYWKSTYGIYGVELNAQMKPIGEPKLVISPTDDWEKNDGNITEGPYMLKHNGIYYLTYSGSNYISQAYAVGYATSNAPLGAYDKYSGNPILLGNAKVAGTAHHCVLKLKDSDELLIIYHRHDSIYQIHERDVCIDRMRFAPTEGGMDRLEVYGPTVTPQPYPLSTE
ncbi:MAG: hypothetical protein E7620_05070 [Ruminococcaceae bacterium]|nr:hypothetical protein [Oscillospiraceae bacterium]